MNADRISELYKGEIFSADLQRHTKERIHWMCAQAEGTTVLDLGCSQGIVSLILAREGFTCTGIDIEQGAIEYARQELAREEEIVRKRVTFQVGDGTGLPFPDASFDTVIMGEIIEHLARPDRLLIEARRVLKPNGKVVVTTPFGYNPHPDHKQTFYLTSFLALVAPIYRPHALETLNNYIVFAGINDPDYLTSIKEKTTDELLAGLHTSLIRKIEERCFTKEVTLYETSTKLYEQIKTLNEKITTLSKANNDASQLLATRDKEKAELALKLNKELEQMKTASQKEIELARIAHQKEIELAKIAHQKEIEQLRGAHLKATEEMKLVRRMEVDELERKYRQNATQKDQEFQKTLASVKKEASDKLLQKEKEFRTQAADLEKSSERALTRKENEWQRKLARTVSDLRGNRRWRVGKLLVDPYEIFADFVKHPADTLNRRSAYFLANRPISGDTTGQPSSPVTSPLPAVEIKGGAGSGLPERRDSAPQAGMKIAAVLDEFSTACFAPDCNLVTFRPDNWKEMLEETKPEMLLVESTWRGNDGSWQYKVASYQKPMGEEIVDLVAHCKSKGIPTVFWNKEDPSNYDRFIHRAPLFDHVFTTDAECIPNYIEKVGHKNVYALPFAAQPAIHNPVVEKQREHNVAFAGAYYNVSFDERKKDMDLILRPALEFGLHIYDRQHGTVGPLAEQFRFPDIYQSSIKGRLEYDEMVKAYKKYKVFLNVNSVKTSPTMFSRRVFELLACGTPVVSASARGIEEMLGTDLVLVSRSEEETRAHLQRVLTNDEEWLRLSVRGIRKVLDGHTYGHRLDEITRKVGIRAASSRQPHVTIVAHPESNAQAQTLAGMIKHQTYRNISVLLRPGKHVGKADVESFVNALQGVLVRVLPTATNLLEAAMKAEGDLVWMINGNDYYAPEFLKDAALAATYTRADIIGKHTYFVLASNGSTIEFKSAGKEYMPVESLAPGSALFRRGALNAEEINTLLCNRTLTVQRGRALSIDRFNYMRDALCSGRTPEHINAIAQKVVL